MKRKLEMDDVREGMYITIIVGKMSERMVPGPNGPMMISKEMDRYNGKVLEVLTIDMPYAVVSIHEPRGIRQDTIDLRQVEVMALTQKYINSLLPGFQFHKDPFWNGINNVSLEQSDTNIKEIFKDL